MGTINYPETKAKVCFTVISNWLLSKFHLLCVELPCLIPSVFLQRLTQGLGNNTLVFAKDSNAEQLQEQGLRAA